MFFNFYSNFFVRFFFVKLTARSNTHIHCSAMFFLIWHSEWFFFFTLLSKKSRVIFTEKSLAWLKNFFVFSSRQTFSFLIIIVLCVKSSLVKSLVFYLVIFRSIRSCRCSEITWNREFFVKSPVKSLVWSSRRQRVAVIDQF